MNFVRNRGGQCEHVPDPLNPDNSKVNPDKDTDCAAEGFWNENQGYRKIPGDQCRGGVSLGPIQHNCGGMRNAFKSGGGLSSLFKLKKVFLYAIIAAAVYYGWPIIEALYIILPFPDPTSSIQSAKSFFGSAWSTLVSIPVLGEILMVISSIVSPILSSFFGSGGQQSS